MGFTVSSLADYVKQDQTDLLTAVQFEMETAALATIHTGIKSATDLPLLSSNPVPQDGSGCTFNASGDTAFTARQLVTKPIKFQDRLCLRDLEAKWTQLLLKKGQNYTEDDVPGKVVDSILESIQNTLEKMDWQGDTTSLNAFLNRYDGLRKIIKTATGTAVATASTFNAANARAIVANVISNIPAALKGSPKVKILMGYDAAETYRMALMNANLYHVATGTGDQKRMLAEGSVHEIVPLHGLDGLTGSTGDNPFIFAMDPERNMHLGVDMENEEELIDIWESKDDQDVKYSVRLRRGWQIAFPSEIVEYSNS